MPADTLGSATPIVLQASNLHRMIEAKKARHSAGFLLWLEAFA